jgi:hypothetical protein
MGIVAYQLLHTFNPLLSRLNLLNSKLTLFVSMSFAAGIAATIYAAILYWFKYPERDMLTDFLDKFKRRLGVKSGE